MSTRFLKTAALVVLTAFSAFALAEETPTRVGRISLSQGQVSISGEEGDEAEAALVNWPVTSRNQLTTGPGSRTEIRIGSTAVRLDADSALDVTELEDDSLRLHLHYGSANITVRNPEVLRGFDLSTPQGNVRMQETGRMRVDAGRREGTTSVSVFDGVAMLDGGGSRLIVRAGKRVEITQDDVRTGLAMRDGFDEWAMLRDLRDERSESVRYVTSEMTGYEDLDQHGSWREDREYGPIWAPRAVPLGWAPYRDGRWTYLHPWGWTWVDNAPWGYAPFHYGRWVMVGSRWCWSPGRNITRVVWSPALVGWVGGSNWNVNFSHGTSRRPAPAQGWYPLAPRDAYVPAYRMNHDNLRYVNRHNGEARDDIRGRARRNDHNQRQGLTVVPHDHFSRRAAIVVPNAPRAIVSTSLLLTAPAVVPPAPQGAVRGRDERRDNRADVRRPDRDGDGRADQRYDNRYDNRADNRNDNRYDGRSGNRYGNRSDDRSGNRYERGQAPSASGSVGLQVTPPAPRPSIIVAQPPQQGAVPAPRRDNRFGNGPDPMRRELSTHMPTPAPALQAAPAPAPQQRREERYRYEREDNEREHRPRAAESYHPQQSQQGASFQVQQQQRSAPPQQQFQQQRQAQPQPQQFQQQRQAQPQPQPQPQRQAAPPPAQQPAAAAQPASSERGNNASQRRAREDANDRR